MVHAIVFDIPHPPSVNKTRKADLATLSAYKDWHRRCDAAILTQKRGPLPKITGRWQATIIFCEDASKADTDNGVKATIDYAVRLGLVEGDNRKLFRRLVVEYDVDTFPAMTIEHGCRLIISAFP